MKLNKFINLVERKGEKAHREAEAMGLKYKGFGYWVDPNTGKVTHKTEGDQLVAVEPDVETDMWNGGDSDEGGAMGPGGQMDKGGMSPMGNQPQLGMPMGSGQNIGSAEPGLEQARKRLSWEPGPDGDTAVDGSEPPADIPADVFVGKTNYYQWVAGPKGTNFKNLSYDNIKNTFEEGFKSYQDDSARKPAPRERQMGVPGLSDFTMGNKGASDVVKQIMQPDRTAVGRTNIDARRALARMPEDAREKQIRSLLSIKNRSRDYKDQSKFDAEQGKAAEAWRAAVHLPAKQKDAVAVDELNKGLGGLVSQPDFDLDQYDDDEFMEGGAFGQIVVGDDHVVKRGQIGPDEMKALYAMKDNPAFPTLLNGRFDGPFKHKSSMYNNPGGADNEKRASGESMYWDPDDKSDWEDKFPVAPGTYAMSRAKGQEAFNTDFDDWDEGDRADTFRKFWRARGELHQAGFSHNDMHGGNVFIDDEGNPTIIDLGLAKDDPVSALMEALGGLDYENQEDYQLSHYFAGASLPDDMREMFDKRRGEFEQTMMDSFSPEASDYDDYDEEDEYSQQLATKQDMLQQLLRGGIRLQRGELDEYRNLFPMLQDRGKVLGLIKALYKGIVPNDLEDRMSKAFDKRQNDSKMIRFANELRAKRGEKSISVRNPNVVPPRNLDFDD